MDLPAGATFQQTLRAAQAMRPGSATATAEQTAEQRARQAADQFVAIAFIQPLLEQMRNDPFKSDLFHGGQAEDIFGQQMDTLLADRIAARTRLPIADAVYRRIMRGVAARQEPTAGPAREDSTTNPD